MRLPCTAPSWCGGVFDGLDRFGRVVDLVWKDTSSGRLLDRYQYAYDRNSNRTAAATPVLSTLQAPRDFLYGLDGLNRIVESNRGRLNASLTALQAGTKNFAQSFGLGATGNMDTFNQDNTGNGVWNLEQTRSHSAANEITSISQEAGQPQWGDPEHDEVGNMVVMPKPDDLTEPMFATYDAWSRLVSVSYSSADLIGAYDYDGLGRRIRKRTYVGGHVTETRDYYYSAGFQSVEERVDGGDLPAMQNVLPNSYRWPAVRSQRGS